MCFINNIIVLNIWIVYNIVTVIKFMVYKWGVVEFFLLKYIIERERVSYGVNDVCNFIVNI